MITPPFIFSAQPLGNAKVFDNFYPPLKELEHQIVNKTGKTTKKQLRLYRVPVHENMIQRYNQYALIAIQGEHSDCLIEIVCNQNLKFIRWPEKNEIETGQRVTIELVDWIDAYLLIEHLMKEDV